MESALVEASGKLMRMGVPSSGGPQILRISRGTCIGINRIHSKHI